MPLRRLVTPPPAVLPEVSFASKRRQPFRQMFSFGKATPVLAVRLTAAGIHAVMEAERIAVAGSRLQHANAMHKWDSMMSLVTSSSRLNLHWGWSTPNNLHRSRGLIICLSGYRTVACRLTVRGRNRQSCGASRRTTGGGERTCRCQGGECDKKAAHRLTVRRCFYSTFGLSDHSPKACCHYLGCGRNSIVAWAALDGTTASHNRPAMTI